jgi:hypothetical protein
VKPWLCHRNVPVLPASSIFQGSLKKRMLPTWPFSTAKPPNHTPNTSWEGTAGSIGYIYLSYLSWSYIYIYRIISIIYIYIYNIPYYNHTYHIYHMACKHLMVHIMMLQYLSSYNHIFHIYIFIILFIIFIIDDTILHDTIYIVIPLDMKIWHSMIYITMAYHSNNTINRVV